MIIELILSYLVIGIVILFQDKVWNDIIKSTAEIKYDGNPTWKVGVFMVTLFVGAVLFWPFFLSSWFSKPKSVLDSLNGNSAFKEQEQLFEALAAMNEDGIDADQFPNGEGEFGLEISNPIPCNTVYGSKSYLGRLITADGKRVTNKRIGSFSSNVSDDPVDGYEIYLDKIRLATVYISPYQKRNSKNAPKGFKLIDA